jgi:transcriptional regulator with XRE-family HTH domain
MFNRFLFGERLVALRTARGISKSALAVRSRISHSWISRVENGKNSPSLGMLEKLARGLGVPIRALLEGNSGRTVPLRDPFIQEVAALLPRLSPAQRAALLARLQSFTAARKVSST